MKVKIHQAYRTIVALCDSDLIEKTFEEGNKCITLHPHFFNGDEKSKEEVIKILKDMDKEDATFNIIGKDSVQTALETGIIKEHGIITIDNVPIALVLM